MSDNEFSRRNFLYYSCVLAGASALQPTSAAATLREPKERLRDKTKFGYFPLVQGSTTQSEAHFTLLMKKGRVLSIQAKNAKNEELKASIYRIESRPFSDYQVVKFKVTQLSDRGNTLTLEQAEGKITDQRTFDALDSEGQSLRFAVASCMNDLYTEQRIDMWASLAWVRPEIVFLVGDTAYLDRRIDAHDEANFWRRHVENRISFSYFRLKHLIPTLTTWDDHDYGADNADERFKEKMLTQELFELFWANEESQILQKGPGLSKFIQLRSQNIFLADDRSFRSPRKTGGSHWGQAQEDFLLQNMNRNTNPTLLMNGSQFFGGYLKKESYQADHSESFMRLLKTLSNEESPVAFVSGDVHFSEIMKIEPNILGYETREFTSSSIHSYTIPGHQYRAKNERRMISTGSHNFMVFDSSSQNGTWSIKTTSFGKEARQIFSDSSQIKR